MLAQAAEPSVSVYVNSGGEPSGAIRRCFGAVEEGSCEMAVRLGARRRLSLQKGARQCAGAVGRQRSASEDAAEFMVGLAHPDGAAMTWQNDAKYYQFWARGTPDGRFAISDVRPRTYELHAIADGVLGEFSKAAITVAAGQSVNLDHSNGSPFASDVNSGTSGSRTATVRSFSRETTTGIGAGI
jgi:hypothetical protein